MIARLLFLLLAIPLVGSVCARPPLPSLYGVDRGADLTVFNSDARPTDVAFQADGSFVLAGDFQAINMQVFPRIARVLPDGKVDSTFKADLSEDDVVESIQVLRNGQILVVLLTDLAKLNADGRIDGEFLPAAKPNGLVAVAETANGDLIVGGRLSQLDAPIVRISAQGGRLPFIWPFTGASDYLVEHLLARRDGKVLVSGMIGSGTGAYLPLFASLNADGSIDQHFDPAAYDGFVEQMIETEDGKIYFTSTRQEGGEKITTLKRSLGHGG